ncbi:hypothetical protein DOM21_14625 [Bacteriovorax stolpii]|uniref:trypsin-like serine protease n=1 Tax=Bacteriovorax stolpii TaxID=960 RepID=UPI0011587FF7|nr:trypsin-like serine protease [Bacteriovorax stolpii]QDK42662.1 hypothetical protein DOM21_14625 [Bacteriovorax stolpii]
MKSILCIFFSLISQIAWAIVDGTPITDSSFRQSVALVYKKDPTQTTGEIYCSGTLIGPRVVISAAHCISSGAKAMKVSVEAFKSQTWIYMGETENAPDLPMVTPQFKNAKVVVHPINDSIYSDIVLIELDQDVDLKKWSINPASLLIPTKELLGKELIHVGYGQITNDGVKGNKALLRLPLKELNGYNGLGVGEMRGNGPGACHGDSGGSAYMSDQKGNLRFVGVEYAVSNHPCGFSATFFVPLNEKIIDWLKSLNRPLFL